MPLQINALPLRDQAALRDALPAHVDPAALAPQDALELLWRSGHVRTTADAWSAIAHLVRAEVPA